MRCDKLVPWRKPTAIGGTMQGTNFEQFSPAEWSTLRQSPVLVYLASAVADGRVDRKEVASFRDLLDSPDKIESELMRALIADIGDELPALIASVQAAQGDFLLELSRVATLVESKLSADDAKQFKRSLLYVGKTVAEASGGFLGLGDKVGHEEKATLAAVSLALRAKL